MNDSEAILTAIDLVSQDILSPMNTSGAIDALYLARSWQIDVIIDNQLSVRGRMKRFGNRPVIFIKPDPRIERMHWTVAHELGEIFCYRVFEQFGSDLRDGPLDFREQVANLLASRILLPKDSFFSRVHQTNYDLLQLKGIYHTASHELIALRILDEGIPSCVTIFDQGQITRRQARQMACARSLSPMEKECWQTCHDRGTVMNQELELGMIQCWPVHEEEWKREIMLLRARDIEAVL